ncbi:hypothetical protein COV16_05835, partial [Candidatus Woesearchaeota archaeon CG10_big_fil_rev_8_21_14_0_10_34_8]
MQDKKQVYLRYIQRLLYVFGKKYVEIDRIIKDRTLVEHYVIILNSHPTVHKALAWKHIDKPTFKSNLLKFDLTLTENDINALYAIYSKGFTPGSIVKRYIVLVETEIKFYNCLRKELKRGKILTNLPIAIAAHRTPRDEKAVNNVLNIMANSVETLLSIMKILKKMARKCKKPRNIGQFKVLHKEYEVTIESIIPFYDRIEQLSLEFIGRSALAEIEQYGEKRMSNKRSIFHGAAALLLGCLSFLSACAVMPSADRQQTVQEVELTNAERAQLSDYFKSFIAYDQLTISKDKLLFALIKALE